MTTKDTEFIDDDLVSILIAKRLQLMHFQSKFIYFISSDTQIFDVKIFNMKQDYSMVSSLEKWEIKMWMPLNPFFTEHQGKLLLQHMEKLLMDSSEKK